MSGSRRTRSPNMAVFSKTLDIAENRAVSHYSSNLSYELRHEKTCFEHMRKQRRRSAVRYHAADQYLCFHYIDSMLYLRHRLDKLDLFFHACTISGLILSKLFRA